MSTTFRFHTNKSYVWYLTKVITTETNLTLPEQVVKEGLRVNYGIYKYAFANSPVITLTLPNAITSILGFAFADSNITTIICRRKNPPQIATQAFDGLARKITIYIPIGSRSNYSNALWQRVSELTLSNGSPAIEIIEDGRATPPVENKISPLEMFGLGTTGYNIELASSIKSIGRLAYYDTYPNKFELKGNLDENSVIEIEDKYLADNKALIKAYINTPVTSSGGTNDNTNEDNNEEGGAGGDNTGGEEGGSTDPGGNNPPSGGGTDPGGDNPPSGGDNESGEEDNPPIEPPSGTVNFKIKDEGGAETSYTYDWTYVNQWGDFASMHRNEGFSVNGNQQILRGLTNIIVDPDDYYLAPVSALDPIREITYLERQI